jgi:hypothetical protein
VLNADVLGTEYHSYDIKTKVVTRALKARHPDFRGSAELTLLPPAHRRDGTAESVGGTGLHFDKRDSSLGTISNVPRRDKIDVTVSVLESTIRDLPTMYGEPLLCDSLTLESKCLPRC